MQTENPYEAPQVSSKKRKRKRNNPKLVATCFALIILDAVIVFLYMPSR